MSNPISHFFSRFGATPDANEIKKLRKSPHWHNNRFENLEETVMDINLRTMPGLLKKQFTNRAGRSPSANITIAPFDKEAFLSPSEKAKFIWYGHSVLLLRMNDKTILIDPMFGSSASPLSAFAVKRFSENTLEIIDTLPPIDLVLLSHDHYDHLDLDSISKLGSKVRRLIVALGCARHLKKWGIDPAAIQEMDWWDTTLFEGIEIVFTPTRHFSGRGLTDRAKSLWGGWVLQTADENIYFSGDSGYGQHFKAVGERLGPFDLGFMECGQYYKLWHQIHMYPEESVQAAKDAKAKVAMPVHWGAFTLSLHHWKEPAERFVAAAVASDQSIITPLLGELIDTNSFPSSNYWWEKLS